MKFNIFKKMKKKEAPKESPSGRVMDLSSRGLSEPEIINSLRKEGYTPSQVDSAMKEAVKAGAEGPGMRPRVPDRGDLLPGELPEEPLGPEARPLRDEPPPERMPPEPGAPESAGPPAPGPEGHREMPRPLRPEEVEGVPRLPEIPGEKGIAPPEIPEDIEEPEEELMLPHPSAIPVRPPRDIPRLQPRYASREKRRDDLKERRRKEITELTEELVDEKWMDVEDRLKDMEENHKELDAKISGIEERMGKIKWEKGEEGKKIKEDVDSYRESIAEVNSKIEGLEKALKSSLVPMMESMRSLSDTVKVLKKGKKTEE